MPALKRRLSKVIYAHMVTDQTHREAAGPSGHSGATLASSTAGSRTHTGTSDKPHPAPATRKPTSAPPNGPLDTKGVPTYWQFAVAVRS
jgi:transposase